MNTEEGEKKEVEQTPLPTEKWRGYDWALLVLGVFVNAMAWGVILWKLPPTEGTIFLHYNIYFGVDLTGPWHEVLYLPGAGLVILLVNAGVAWFVKSFSHIVRAMSLAMTVFLELGILLASVLVVLLNN